MILASFMRGRSCDPGQNRSTEAHTHSKTNANTDIDASTHRLSIAVLVHEGHKEVPISHTKNIVDITLRCTTGYHTTTRHMSVKHAMSHPRHRIEYAFPVAISPTGDLDHAHMGATEHVQELAYILARTSICTRICRHTHTKEFTRRHACMRTP